MCFSAGASFAASAFLFFIGILTLYRAPRGYRMLAAIPLLFAIQQFSEGWLWLILQGTPVTPKGPIGIPFAILSKASKTLSYYMDVKKVATTAFLLFAYVIWPFWIPTSFWRVEEQGTLRHALLFAFFILGTLLSAVMLFGMLMSNMSGTIVENHIVYSLPKFFESASQEGLLAYAIATIVPFFISSLAGAWVMGLFILGSLIVTIYVWGTYLTSVWCFFSALLSVLVLWFLPRKSKQ